MAPEFDKAGMVQLSSVRKWLVDKGYTWEPFETSAVGPSKEEYGVFLAGGRLTDIQLAEVIERSEFVFPQDSFFYEKVIKLAKSLDLSIEELSAAACNLDVNAMKEFMTLNYFLDNRQLRGLVVGLLRAGSVNVTQDETRRRLLEIVEGKDWQSIQRLQDVELNQVLREVVKTWSGEIDKLSNTTAVPANTLLSFAAGNNDLSFVDAGKIINALELSAAVYTAAAYRRLKERVRLARRVAGISKEELLVKAFLQAPQTLLSFLQSGVAPLPPLSDVNRIHCYLDYRKVPVVQEEDEDTTMLDKDTEGSELSKMLPSERGLEKLQGVLDQDTDDGGDRIKAFKEIMRLLEWARELGLHMEFNDLSWVLSFPLGEEGKMKKVYQSSSVRDLVLILSTVRLSRVAFGGKDGVYEKDADLVIPRVLET